MPTRSELTAVSKSEETRARILNSALTSFRKRGFEAATMRDFGQDAGVALGAAYYYFTSKDAIVMDFYRRSCEEMQPKDRGGARGRLRFGGPPPRADSR